MAAELVLESEQQCVDWVLSGCRPRSAFRIGTEYERLVLGKDGRPVSYEGDAGIAAIFERLMKRYAWRPLLEGALPIALERSGASVSLEPAGQFELSGAPLALVDAMVAERDHHLAELDDIAQELGLCYVYAGMNPIDTPASVPKMPKKRYDHMRAWMPQVGSLGLDMMHLTCTVQANLDYETGEEAMEMFRAAYLATPVLIALFANSPWRHGAPTGMASTRAWIWTDVDNARCDPGDWVFDPGATVDDYVQWALDVPLYFVQHKAEESPGAAAAKAYLPADVPGKTFRQFLQQGDRGRRATLADFELHMSTLFPDVRLKRYLEIRAADCVPPELLPALPALCKGLLYDAVSRRATLALLRDGDDHVDRKALRAAACKDGLDGRSGTLALGPLAIALVDLARCGLQRLEQEYGPDVAALEAIDAIDAIAHGEREALWKEADRKLRAQPSLLALAAPCRGRSAT